MYRNCSVHEFIFSFVCLFCFQSLEIVEIEELEFLVGNRNSRLHTSYLLENVDYVEIVCMFANSARVRYESRAKAKVDIE
jgi:hypothetical protein